VAVLAGSLAYGAAAGRGVGAASGFLHGRADTWGAAVETFADRPLIGTGADAFLSGSAVHQDGQTIAFAHDLPLELAAELGIAGIVLAALLYAASASTLWRARRTPAAWLLGPASAAFLISSLVDWPWHLAGAGAVWALATGGIAGSLMKRPDVPIGSGPARSGGRAM
jgi:O-antigen ligase